MNTKNYFTLGMAALSLSCGSLAFGAKTLDNFDTFTGAVSTSPAGSKGFAMTANTATPAVVDNVGGAPEGVVTPTDTDFTSLLRRATLTRTGGTGDAAFNNSTPVDSANWSNDTGVNSTAFLRYDMPAQDFTLTGQNFSQIDFLFNAVDLGVQVKIDVFGATGFGLANPYLTGTLSVPGIIFPTTQSVLATSLTGVNGGTYASIWNSVKSITFTFTSLVGASDMSLDSIGFSNPQVPEAETMIPVVAFAGAAGFMAWRRRASK